ncbi:MAG: hypothetical protein ABI855_20755, partial [Bacteroidota bacterium]
KQYGKRKNEKDFYYLTECNIAQSIRLIDFAYCENLSQMFEVLNYFSIEVMNENFKTYEEESGENINTFLEIKEYLDNSLDKDKSIYMKSGKLLIDTGILGQRLTDFDNGTEFLKSLKKSLLSYDGYRWREENDQRGFTYCFFNFKKIGDPKTDKVKFKR